MTYNTLKDVLKVCDPARTMPQERIAQLEARILERVAVTPQLCVGPGPGFAPGIRLQVLPMASSIVAACLLVLLGAFVGRGLNPSYVGDASVASSGYGMSAVATPWQTWFVAQGEVTP